MLNMLEHSSVINSIITNVDIIADSNACEEAKIMAAEMLYVLIKEVTRAEVLSELESKANV